VVAVVVLEVVAVVVLEEEVVVVVLEVVGALAPEEGVWAYFHILYSILLWRDLSFLRK
jgi:hypothetical protein